MSLSPTAPSLTRFSRRGGVVAAILGLMLAMLAPVAPAFATPFATVTVHVADLADDSDLQYATVTVTMPDDENVYLSSDTDETGTAVIAIDAVGTYVLNIQHPGYATIEQSFPVIGAGDIPVSVSLSPATASITVNVSGPDGVISNAQIEVTTQDNTGGGFEFSDVDGTHTFAELGAGSYDVTVRANGFSVFQTTVTLDVAQEAVVNAELTELVVGTVTGTVRDFSNNPIAHINVDIFDPLTGIGAGVAETGSDGTFAIDVEPGTYTIRYFDGPYYDGSKYRIPAYETLLLGRAHSVIDAATFTVAADQVVANKNIQLKKGATIKLHVNLKTPDGVVNASPSTFPGAHVYEYSHGAWREVDLPSPFAGNGGAGDLWIIGLPAGTYRLGFVDDATGGRAWTTQYWSGAKTLGAAKSVAVTSGSTTTLGAVTVSIPRPLDEPVPAGTEELTPETEDAIDPSDSEFAQGDIISVEVGEEYAGEWVSVFAHSDPTPMSHGWVQVRADGTVPAIAGYELPTGEHSLTVQLADDSVVGWSTVTVTDAETFRAFTTAPKPTISGTVAVGRTLTAKPGTWSPSGATFDYQWKVNGEDVLDATASTFVVRPTDLGAKVSVSVTGHLLGYVDKAVTSNLSATVAKGALGTKTPLVSGTRTVGHTLAATVADWSPAGTALTYQWYRETSAIIGATDPTYELAAADKGKLIRVRVTGSAEGYKATSKYSSSSVSDVKSGTIVKPTSIVIDGSPIAGETLSASFVGEWSPQPLTVKYSWRANGVAISGATADTYVVKSSDAGKTISVKATASRTGYTTATLTSAATGTVTKLTFELIKAPKLSVNNEFADPERTEGAVGYTLTATTGTWSVDPTTVTYAWYRNGSLISGATGSSYLLVSADGNKNVKVTVTVKKANYTDAKASSVEWQIFAGSGGN
jgi:hypothetical protein